MNPACTAESRGRHRSFVAALVVFIIVILVAAPQAQEPQQPQATPPASYSNAGLSTNAPPAAQINATAIDLLVGRSTILNVGTTVTRVSLTVPDVADALVTTPTQLLIHGKQPGTISMFVWDRSGAIRTYEVNVRRDLKALKEQVQQLFPGEPITIVGSGKDVVLSGTVSTKYVVEKAADVASGYVEKKENVVNLLQQQEGVASNQVMLRVRFAEVSRSALQELGASWFTGPAGFRDYVSQVTTEQFPAMGLGELSQNVSSTNGAFRTSDQTGGNWGGGRDTVTDTGGKGTFSDLLNIFLFNNRYNVGTLIRAMQERGLFQSLAEPNLIATNGKEASFLAGGEYPYPVVQPGGSGNAVTIMFKEFGIRLNFTPTVLGGDLIGLKVRPEVSALDFSNAITLEGFRIPALSTRRTETEVELRDGQTFAIAGLLNNTVTDTMRKIPGIGDVPILGWLFKSKAMQKNQTELVVMITPTIVRRGSMGVSEGLPSMVQPYLGAPSKTVPPPAPYTGSPRYPASGQPAPRGGARNAPAPQPQPVARPIQGSATLPNAPASNASPAPPEREPAMSAPAPAPSKADAKAAERDRIEAAKQYADEQKAAKAAAAEEEKASKEQARKDAEAKRRNERLEKERQARDAELAKKKAEQDAKREKALAEAAARLKAAQTQYQEELEKAKGGANDKAKTSGKSSTPKS
jgi:pilus assembly protein CpaC